MKSLFIILSAMLGWSSCLLHAQEVISSSGTHASGTGISLSWTVGEPVIGTVSNGNVILTQGFHQPKLSASATDDIVIPGLSLAVYPNPFTYALNLRIDKGDFSNLRYTVFSLDGKALSTAKVIRSVTQIDFQQVASGDYLLKVTGKSGKPLKTFKVIKQ